LKGKKQEIETQENQVQQRIDDIGAKISKVDQEIQKLSI